VTPVSVSVTPATGLTDGQIVAVHAGGLPPEHTIQVEQCAGTAAAPPPDNTACDGLTLDTQAGSDAAGQYVNAPGDVGGDTGFRVYTRPSRLLNAPTTITCDAAHPCVLYVGVDQNDFSKPHAFAEIRFAGGVVAPPAVSVPASGVPVSGLPAGGVPAAVVIRPAPPTTAATTAVSAAPAATGGASLAFTGASAFVPATAALGLAAVAIASVARRRLLRSEGR
jgi:Neocarzinostatin family